MKKHIFPLLTLALVTAYCDARLVLEGTSYLRREFVVLSKEDTSNRWIRTKGYAIATDSLAASQAGADILKQGGNIVDSAIAVSFAISVVRPQSTGLGGGGFLLLHLNGKTKAFDFRERAPLAAYRQMYVPSQKAKKQSQKSALNATGKKKENINSRPSLIGIKAVAVPGMIAGLLQIHKQYGKLSLAQVLAPAIGLAKEGFPIYADLKRAIVEAYDDMDKAMREVFAPKGSDKGKRLQVGDLCIQRDLAKALQCLAEQGVSCFYSRKGKMGLALVKLMRERGGIITARDLSRYRMYESEPIWANYRGFRIATMPLPSSGIFLVRMLKMLEAYPLKQLYNVERTRYYHTLIQVMRHGYEERERYGGDPRFVPIAKQLKSLPSFRLTPLKIKNETTHFSIMDDKGNAVASTQSINYRFGARVMLPKWGIVLNDTMDDFSIVTGQPNVYGLTGGDANAIAAAKTPLSSMSPSFLFDKQGLRLALGAPGGSQIITSILQAIIHDVDLKMHPFAVVARGRIHHQYKPQTVFVEPQAMQQKERDELGKQNYSIVIRPSYAKVFLVKRYSSGDLIGVSDPRGQGQPIGASHSQAQRTSWNF